MIRGLGEVDRAALLYASGSLTRPQYVAASRYQIAHGCAELPSIPGTVDNPTSTALSALRTWAIAEREAAREAIGWLDLVMVDPILIDQRTMSDLAYDLRAQPETVREALQRALDKLVHLWRLEE